MMIREAYTSPWIGNPKRVEEPWFSGWPVGLLPWSGGVRVYGTVTSGRHIYGAFFETYATSGDVSALATGRRLIKHGEGATVDGIISVIRKLGDITAELGVTLPD